VKAIQDKQQKYVMAIPRQWSKKYLHNTVIQEDHMEEMETHLYATTIDNESSTSDERLVLCLNTQKREDDQAYRNKCIETIQKELEALKERVHGSSLSSSMHSSPHKNKRTLSRDEVMKKAGSILKDTYAGKYFHVYTVEANNKNKPSNTNHATTSSSSTKEDCKESFQESFRFQYDILDEKVKEDQRLDGTFLIQTNQRSDSKKRLIEIYKHLNTVENAFRILKNDLDVRPIYHWKENRVKGHVYMCVIAYFLMMAIEYTSKCTNLHRSGRKILRLLSNIHLLTLTLPKGEKRFALTGVGKEEQKVLKAFGIPKIKAPMVV
jgi:transposase